MDKFTKFTNNFHKKMGKFTKFTRTGVNFMNNSEIHKIHEQFSQQKNGQVHKIHEQFSQQKNG